VRLEGRGRQAAAHIQRYFVKSRPRTTSLVMLLSHAQFFKAQVAFETQRKSVAPQDEGFWGLLTASEGHVTAAVVQGIRSTHCAREAPGSKGSPKYWVSRATFPSTNSMMLTV
jgi:hypothetical protein